MKIDFNDMLYALSYALDCVEHELIGVATYHSKRVAFLCSMMGKQLGFTEDQQREVMACAILHDSALTEYIEYEYHNGVDIAEQIERIDLGQHCTMGEKNIRLLPLGEECRDAVLYHHENADGSGPFHKTEEETPLYAQLIHLADMLDAGHNLSIMNEEKFKEVTDFIRNGIGILFSEQCADAFLSGFTLELACQLQTEDLDKLLRGDVPLHMQEYDHQQILDMAQMFANVIDYKSEFTRKHSQGVAQKAMEMTRFYRYDEETVTQMYLAGALHDIGKLVVNKDVLEKPDHLTHEEYKHMQNHAYYSYDILNRIHGLEDITMWASLHHEKLDGTGYPFGKKGSELNHLERLMACIDIYQALTEERPYKKQLSHQAAIDIMNSMVSKNQLDGGIVADMDARYGA